MTHPSNAVTWKGRCGPLELGLSDQTFVPSSISRLLADALDVKPGDVVIDLGCGSGVLSIVAAKLGAGEVHGVDAAPDTEAVARGNAEKHGVAEVTRFYRGDLFEPLPRDLRADLIIGDVSGIPDPLARVSGWFPNGEGGGPTGSELPGRMIEEAEKWLRPGGTLLLPTGSIQDESAILGAAHERFPQVVKRLDNRFPMPRDLANKPEVTDLIDKGIVQLSRRGSRLIWEAGIWECFKPGQSPQKWNAGYSW